MLSAILFRVRKVKTTHSLFFILKRGCCGTMEKSGNSILALCAANFFSVSYLGEALKFIAHTVFVLTHSYISIYS